MKYRFTKMQGCGNDYIYFDCMDKMLENPQKLSVQLSDRHFGVGGDGIILICPSDVADAKMRMFNLDGSEGQMCGNGIRCVGKYLYDNGLVNRDRIIVETLSGVKTLQITANAGVAELITVDMGQAKFTAACVPVDTKAFGENMLEVIDQPVKIGGTCYRITCVSMGNPHCVVFCDDLQGLEIERVGPLFEHSPIFPERINIEFIKVQDSHNLDMRVWERGSGETLACGTGTAAAAAAAVKNGVSPAGEDINVNVKGGTLTIKYTQHAVYMTGPAVKVFEGVVEV